MSRLQFQGLPVVSAAEMADIDRRAVADCGIPAVELMENAGKAVAGEMLSILGGLGVEHPLCAVFCGRGNNGGDGLVISRYLRQAGIPVKTFILPPGPGGEYSPQVSLNLKKLNSLSVEIHALAGDLAPARLAASRAVLVCDALLGTGTSGAPKGILKDVVELINSAGKPVAAVDLPTGVNPDTGVCSRPCVKARWTFMLGLPKLGLINENAKPYVGLLKTLEIGFPKQLFENL